MNFTYESLANAGQFTALNVGTALANSTTATDISPGGNTAGDAFTFPANGPGALQPNQWWRVRAKGIVSNTSTPTLTLGVYLGGVAGTALATTGAVATAASLSNNFWSLELDFRVVTPGTAGSAYAIGSASGPFAAAAWLPASSSSGNLVTGLNTSVANILTVGATWGSASASNTITCILLSVERMNEGGS